MRISLLTSKHSAVALMWEDSDAVFDDVFGGKKSILYSTVKRVPYVVVVMFIMER